MTQSSPKKPFPIWLIALPLAVILIGLAAFFFYFQTYHFAAVQDRVLYRMGMRDTRELQNVLRQVHPKTVVCLVTDEEVKQGIHGDFQGEFAALQKNGITLIRIP